MSRPASGIRRAILLTANSTREAERAIEALRCLDDEWKHGTYRIVEAQTHGWGADQ